jgi:aldose 1-epimerase
MLYHIETEERVAGGHTSTVYTLRRRDVGSSAEIWQGHGFNCLHWCVNGIDMLYSANDWNENPLPSRSGVPILFPFPNRIAEGKFSTGGASFSLPKNDSNHQNAIHGYVLRSPWRICGYGADAESAWLHGEFQLSIDGPESADLWPGDATLTVVYRLFPTRLRMEMNVTNQSDRPFPFGIGLHPYFRLSSAKSDVSDYQLHAPARSIWPLTDCLPNGAKVAVPDELNWNRPRRIGNAKLDTLYTDLGAIQQDTDGSLHRATLSDLDSDLSLQVWASNDFRESVLFTPPHRQAVCIEPYTCATNAVNLQARGHDAGWRELPVGGAWSGHVEFRVAPQI